LDWAETAAGPPNQRIDARPNETSAFALTGAFTLPARCGPEV
jgi:hypothetical protein